ncbi:MAG: hypothetical protein ABI557_21235 [Aureliella sp.]
MLDETPPQPFLPRVRMIWFFVVVTVVAVTLTTIRVSNQEAVFRTALIFTGLFMLLVGVLFGICFLVAYCMGSLERAIVGKDQQPTSPFSDGSLPPQIIPPKRMEDHV